MTSRIAPSGSSTLGRKWNRSDVDGASAGLCAAWDARALTWIAPTRRSDSNVIVVKDTIDVEGAPTSAGVLPPWRERAERDATVVDRAKRAGYSVVAKANLQPWAVGASGANPDFGSPANPLNEAIIPGGSSSGSAVAVALGACDWALGTDSGGSVRIPAACCGILGFKPTTGTVPMDGVLSLSPTLDCIGVLGRDIASVARAWNIIAAVKLGPGPLLSPRTLPRLGAVPAAWLERLDDASMSSWVRMTQDIPTVDLPPLGEMRRTAHGILAYEALQSLSNHGVCEQAERHKAVSALLAAGREMTERHYEELLAMREHLRGRVEGIFDEVDILIAPTLSTQPPLWSQNLPDARLTAYTIPFNLTGHPVLSLPVGSSFPAFSVQLVVGLGRDYDLLSVAKAVIRILCENH